MSCLASQYRKVLLWYASFQAFPAHSIARWWKNLSGSGQPRKMPSPLYSESYMQFRWSLDFIKGGIGSLFDGGGGNRSLRPHLNDNKESGEKGFPPFW